MKIIGLLLPFLTGCLLANFISKNRSKLEILGLSFPIGLGIISFILFLFNITGLKINILVNIISIQVLIFIGLCIINYRKKHHFFNLTSIYFKVKVSKLKNIHLSTPVFIVISCIVLYALVSKSLFWPVFNYDSITGFDFLAKAIVKEGTFQNSIFTNEIPLYSPRSLYPPLFSLSLAYAYLIGFQNSQIIMVIFFLSIFISTYGIILSNSNHLTASFFSLLLIITPEFASFSALSSSNIPCTYYCAFGIIYLFNSTIYDNKGGYLLGLLLLLFAVWTRSEAIIFCISCFFIVIKYKNLNTIILKYGIILLSSLSVFIIWQLFLKYNLKVFNQQPVSFDIFFNIHNIEKIWSEVVQVTFLSKYYGILVYLFLAIALINLFFIKSDYKIYLLFATILTSWVLTIVLYTILNTNYSDWITSGYKRNFFYFLPILVYFIASTKVIKIVFGKFLSLDN